MSQDTLADTLNVMVNAMKAGRTEVVVARHSKLLLSVLAIAKMKGYVKDYKIVEGKLKIEIGKLHDCNAIKPRFAVTCDEIDNYTRRYLPAKNIGLIIISTSSGLMTHQTAQDKNLGGSLIAYFF